MSLDEQVMRWADQIEGHSSLIKGGLRKIKSGQVQTEFEPLKRAMTAALGKIKETMLRAQRDGLQERLAVELERRGYGKR
jgi:hypothetical protein